MGRINYMEQVIWEERRRNPTPALVCDGCSRRFHGVPPEDLGYGDEDEDSGDEDEDTGDAGDPFKRCTECDYTVCEDCTHPENQGIFMPPVLPHFIFYFADFKN